MANGERLQVMQKYHHKAGGNADDLYARPQNLQLPYRELRRDDYSPANKGFRGTKLNHEEVAAAVEAAHQMGLKAQQVDVYRVSNKGKQKTLQVAKVASQINAYENMPAREIAKERYRVAMEAEDAEHKRLGEFRNSLWTSGLARIIASPVNSIKTVVKGLGEDSRMRPFALLNIQDSVASGVQLHFPEFENKMVKPANAVMKFLRWRPIAYVTSLLTFGPWSPDVFLDAPQAFADFNQGKGYRRTNQDAIVLALDAIFSPFFNLAIAGKALDRSNAINRRADYALAKEAMTDPSSKFYKERAGVAEAILSANSVGRNFRHEGKFAQEINMDRVQQEVDNHDYEVARTGWFSRNFGPKGFELLKREQHLKWQKEIAQLMDTARGILPDYYDRLAAMPQQPTIKEGLSNKGKDLLNKLRRKQSSNEPAVV